MKERKTTIQISKSTLSSLNQMRAAEAGRLGEGSITQEEFINFLLNLYQAVKDDPVINSVWKKIRKEV